jgi:HK97 family phage prohead protease
MDIDKGQGKSAIAFQAPSLAEFKLLTQVSAEDGGQDGIGSEPGSFAGYLARYGNLDDNGDVIAPGAFAQSLSKYNSAGELPPMFLNHAGIPWNAVTTESLLPIGVWTSLTEDQNGMRATGRIDPVDTDLGKRIYAGLRNKSVKGLSIGYMARDFVRGTKSGEPRRMISRADLFEGSVVWMPANTLATIDTVKSRSLAPMLSEAFGDAFSEMEFDHRNVRHLELLLHKVAGYSRSESKGIIANGFKSLNPTREADGSQELRTALAGLKSALSAISPS